MATIKPTAESLKFDSLKHIITNDVEQFMAAMKQLPSMKFCFEDRDLLLLDHVMVSIMGYGNFNRHAYKGFSPLMIAVKIQRPLICEALLSHEHAYNESIVDSLNSIIPVADVATHCHSYFQEPSLVEHSIIVASEFQSTSMLIQLCSTDFTALGITSNILYYLDKDKIIVLANAMQSNGDLPPWMLTALWTYLVETIVDIFDAEGDKLHQRKEKLQNLLNQPCKKLDEYSSDELASFVKTMLDMNANINLQSDYGKYTLLMVIVLNPSLLEKLHKSPSMLDELICKSDQSKKTKFGDTALMCAASKENDLCRSIMDKLVINGADITTKNNDKDTILMETVQKTNLNSLDDIKFLLENGADAIINEISSNNYTALMYRIKKIICRQSIDILKPSIELLLEHGADPNITCWSDGSVLHLALDSVKGLMLTDSSYSIDSDYLCDVLKLLLDAGTRTTHLDRENNTALMLASSIGNVEAIKLIMEYSDKFDVQEMYNDVRKSSAGDSLFTKVASRSPTLMRCIKSMHPLHAQNDNGMTALEHAIKYGRHDAVKYLLEAGSQLCVETLERYYPYRYEEKQMRDILSPYYKE